MLKKQLLKNSVPPNKKGNRQTVQLSKMVDLKN